MQEGIYDRLVPILVGATKSLTLGDGFNPTVVAGPLISQIQLDVSCAAALAKYHLTVEAPLT